MSELVRQALIGHLGLGPRELVRAVLAAGDDLESWEELPRFTGDDVASAYRLVQAMYNSDVPGRLSAQVFTSWMLSADDEAATLFAAASLTEPDELAGVILELIAAEGQQSMTPRQRIAHLLERTHAIPVREFMALATKKPAAPLALRYMAFAFQRRGSIERDQLDVVIGDPLRTRSTAEEWKQAALELAAVVKAWEALDVLQDHSQTGADNARRALVVLGAIAAQPVEAYDLFAPRLYQREGGTSYWMIPIGKLLPVPRERQWEVPDAQRAEALDVLVDRLQSGQLDPRTASVAINGVARSRLPRGLECLTQLVNLSLRGAAWIPQEALANALPHFEEPEAREALERLAEGAAPSSRRAVLQALHSTPAEARDPLVPRPTEFLTHAAILHRMAEDGVSLRWSSGWRARALEVRGGLSCCEVSPSVGPRRALAAVVQPGVVCQV